MGKPKKGKKKAEDDWEDDVLNELETLKEDKPKEQDSAKKMEPQTDNVSSRFQALNIDDDEEGDKDKHEDDSADKTVPKKKKDKKKKDTDDLELAKGDEDNNDASERTENQGNGVTADHDVDELAVGTSKKSKKKKKEKKMFDPDDELDTEEGTTGNEKNPPERKTLDAEVGGDEASEPLMKTAAQKRAEKKEREKKKKEAEKAKKAAKAKKEMDTKDNKDDEKLEEPGSELGKPSAEVGDEQVGATSEAVEGTGAGDPVEDAEGEEGGEEGEEVKDKKKKKKKKKGEKEEKKVKKPNKALVKQMQEQLERLKLEEEKRKKEEEEKLRALEEAENRRLEKIRLEQERKDKKKQKEKERKARLKQEGKLLTPAQRQQKARQQAMLDAMRQQGIVIPAMANQQEAEQEVKKKPVRYGSKKPKNKAQQQSEPTVAPEVEAEKPKEEQGSENLEELPTDDQDESTEAKTEEEPGWEEGSSEVKESWELEEEDATGTAGEAPNKEQTAKEQGEEEDDEDDEEDESEDSESEEGSSAESESSSEEEEEDDDESEETIEERIQRRRTTAEANRSMDNLRSPVICVLGHVDTGKTKILDKIRHTHVQDGEAGGITQQIGATMVPLQAVREQTKMIKDFQEFEMKIPGLLIIDTPGHESFSNLRSRGSSLCDMAILVVDIMHGLEPQTIESINLLKSKKTPFIVALNKVDRLFEWKRGPNSSIIDTVKKQKRNTKQEYDERVQIAIREFSEQGLNAALFYNNPDARSYVSLVPTSAHTGDGMGDLISQIVKLTQTRMAPRLSYSEELQSMVLEVKALHGMGTTVDVILINGKLREGDTVVLAGVEGPIVTQIRALLTPQPLKELRVKNQYINHKEVQGAQGVKICAKDFEKVLAGVPMLVAQSPDEVDFLKAEVSAVLSDTLKSIKLSERGVYVQASTLGSLEALLEFLRTSEIPYCGVNIGPVHKKDVMKCSVMLEHDSQYAVILAFDVRIERDAQEIADSLGVKIFSADIIYHLFDKFTAYREEYKNKKKEEFRHAAVFPCKLRIMPQHIFNTRDPIVVGVIVESGVVREGTPLCVPSKEFLNIGVVTGIEANHKPLEVARKGMEVCVKIEALSGEAPKLYGRHFDHNDLVMSKISRDSIDVVKEYFRDEMQKSDWQLMIELKKLFQIL